MVTVYYSEKIQIKITQGKRNIRQCPGEFKCGTSSLPLPKELCKKCLLLIAMMCDNTHVILPSGEAFPSLGVQNLYWGLGM